MIFNGKEVYDLFLGKNSISDKYNSIVSNIFSGKNSTLKVFKIKIQN
jgi:hypothetical protein